MKPCTNLTDDERAAILAAIRTGKLTWAYPTKSKSPLTLADVEVHGLIDRERGLISLGGFAVEVEGLKP